MQQEQEGAAHLKARFDDGERQHADAGHGSSAGAQQHGLAGVGRPVQEVVLLEGVEGAEVDAHARDAADERLQEGTSQLTQRTAAVTRARYITRVHKQTNSYSLTPGSCIQWVRVVGAPDI